MLERVLEAVVVTVHYGFVLYLVVGGFLARRWPRTIWAHLAAAAVVVVSWIGFARGRRREPALS